MGTGQALPKRRVRLPRKSGWESRRGAPSPGRASRSSARRTGERVPAGGPSSSHRVTCTWVVAGPPPERAEAARRVDPPVTAVPCSGVCPPLVPSSAQKSLFPLWCQSWAQQGDRRGRSGLTPSRAGASAQPIHVPSSWGCLVL